MHRGSWTWQGMRCGCDSCSCCAEIWICTCNTLPRVRQRIGSAHYDPLQAFSTAGKGSWRTIAYYDAAGRQHGSQTSLFAARTWTLIDWMRSESAMSTTGCGCGCGSCCGCCWGSGGGCGSGCASGRAPPSPGCTPCDAQADVSAASSAEKTAESCCQTAACRCNTSAVTCACATLAGMAYRSKGFLNSVSSSFRSAYFMSSFVA